MTGSFWDKVTGPAREELTPELEGKVKGAIVCPGCNNILARVIRTPSGYMVRCWTPANAIRQPDATNTRAVGWTQFRYLGTVRTTDDRPGQVHVDCWRGHHVALMIDDCWEIARAPKSGVRRPATIVTVGSGRLDSQRIGNPAL